MYNKDTEREEGILNGIAVKNIHPWIANKANAE